MRMIDWEWVQVKRVHTTTNKVGTHEDKRGCVCTNMNKCRGKRSEDRGVHVKGWVVGRYELGWVGMNYLSIYGTGD